MGRRIYHELRPIRRRQQAVYLLHNAGWGLLGSSLLGVVLGIYRWAAQVELSWALGLVILVAGPVLGLLVGLAQRRTWHMAASAVDRHYDLKDRTTTALDFLARPDAGPLHELEIQDAIEHLKGIEPSAVVPFRVPRSLPLSAAALALATLLIAWPLATPKAKAGPSKPLPQVLEQAKTLEEDLKQLDELAKKERDPELEKLLNELKLKVEELKQPGVDERAALAKLSEMQAAIAHQQAQYNTGLVDGQLQSLGAAMTPAEALEAAGQALQEAQFDKAAQELEKLEDPQIDRKEAKAVEEKLKQVAKEAGDAGLGQLGDAASELAEGVKGNKGKFLKATKTLAKLTKVHSRRRKLNQLLAAECDRIGECKSNCQRNSLVRGKKPEKSTSPKNTLGLTTSGNVLGDRTNILAKRNVQTVTGEAGEGPSEVETTHSPEGRQFAARGYKEAYQRALKKSEAVLDSEPIPLGHRQTIRRYFESIRPQNETEDDPAIGTAENSPTPP
ncbi:MAG: hypothetical protein IRY99_04235 [Isosphaeraceae bacterium]|nr:hypothetical protein [Isosphaeraceae bacterium]